MRNTGGSEKTHLSYLEVIKNKREQARNEQERKRELDRSVKATVRSGTSLTGVIKHENQKNRETVGRVKVENEDLAKSNDIQELASCIKDLGQILKPEGIDWQPVESALATLNSQVAKLPTEYPQAPAPVESVTVKNIPDLEPTLKKIIEVLGKLKLNPTFDPKITVKPADVKVTEHTLDTEPVVKAVESLVPVLESLRTVTEQKDDTELLDSIRATTKAITSLRFPVPNYVLPYKSIDGKSTPVTLNADGSIPVTFASSTYKTLLDDYTTTNVTYVGKASIGSATSAAVWQIQKIDETTGMSITWADNANFTQVWDDRVGLVYS